MRVLVTGADGRLGRAVVAGLAGHDVRAVTIELVDLRDGPNVRALVSSTRPDAIVNCAAFTDVDGSEDRPVEALGVNAFAVRTLAAAAGEAGAVFVHYSTDFVFDGEGDRPYEEEDPPNPRSTYACSKLIGEWFAAAAPRHYVLRVESLFGAPAAGGAPRPTSVDRIVEAIREGRPVRAFADRTVTPSYVPDVAAVTRGLLERGAPAGLYHCVNSGVCTWLELAAEASRQLGVRAELVPVAVANAGLKAERPRYCALSNRKLREAGFPLRSWQDALTAHLSRSLT